VLNLEAEPHARLSYRDKTRDVVARAATDPERADILATAASVYVGYTKYRQRITGRALRIFVLDPA
jgi:deazaflavin-dependent oxidoreductase (nitroreductase family)